MRLVFDIRRFAWVPLMVLLLGSADTHGALFKRTGADIYKQQCAKCHGKTGEGVKGKYDDPLVGDWSIEKLTRYVDKNMPDDAPGKCKGPDADAVSRYMFDAFYSREARARNNPARVELARLTNRQFLVSVADIFKNLTTGTDRMPTGEHGLKAQYYNGRGYNNNRMYQERVDRELNFEFGTTNKPSDLVTNATEFGMRWRGSIVVEESGEYDFVVRTPNGFRFWVNRETENDPVIDASVASAQNTEHHAVVRLIGGRAYPFTLEWFKFRDKSASLSVSWKPPHGIEQIIPARNLTTETVPSTMVVSTTFPPDDSSVGYERGVQISKAWDEATTQSAIEVANYVSKNLNRFSRSKPRDNDRAARVEQFCVDFAANAFRRPLTEEQKELYVRAQLKKAEKEEDAIKRIVLLVMKSPRFLYPGLAMAKPDDYDVAERLALSLWDSVPDRELLKAAGQGALHTPAQVAQQTQRMLADPRTHAKMQYFMQQWLQLNHVENLSKDTTAFPGFTPEIVADLRTSLQLFLDDVVWTGNADYRRLLLADYMYLNNRLAKFYGVATNATDEFVKVSLDPKQRSGVVTHPYLLAAFSYPKSTSPIHRGVFLTRNIVGRTLRPPPMAVSFKDADFAPNLTMREKITQLTRPEACANCHSVINPLGFSLEQYDAVGRFRTKDNNKPINTVSEYTTDDGNIVVLKGARDLAEYAAKSDSAQNRFIEVLFHQMVKQPVMAYGPDALKQLHQSFVASQFNIQKLLADIAAISALHGFDKPTVTAKKET